MSSPSAMPQLAHTFSSAFAALLIALLDFDLALRI
jgi:hypothetical protein